MMKILDKKQKEIENEKFKNLISCVLIVGFLSVIICATAFVGCKKEPAVYKIGANLILTGSAAMSGEYVKNGIDLAVEEINEAGGIKNKKVEIVYGDNKNDPKEAVSIFNKLVTADRVPAIISMFSSPSLAQVKLADEKKVVLATTIVSLPGIGNMSPWVFRYFISIDAECSVLADFIFTKQNIKKIGFLYINDDYGRGGFKSFKDSYEKLGGSITFAESFEKNDIDFRSILFRLKATNPEGVCVIGYDKPLGIIIKQIREVGIKSQIFAPMSLSVPVVLEQAGDAAEGAYLTMSNFDIDYPATPLAKKFITNYQKKFGKLPSHYSAFAYDLVRLICRAIEMKGYTPSAIKDGLLSIINYPAVMGNVTILPNGETEFSLSIKRIKKGKIVPLFESK